MSQSTTRPTSSADPNAQDERWARQVAAYQKDPSPPFEQQWATFQEIFRNRKPEDGPPVAWCPDPARIQASNLGQVMTDLGCQDYQELHAWSVANRAGFWEKVIDRLSIVFSRRPDATIDSSAGPRSPQWLPGARLNIVDSCFGAPPESTAIVSGREGSEKLARTSYRDLEIKCAMDGHFHQDIGSGDTVAWPTNIGWMMGPWLIYASLMNQATIALYEGAPTGDGFARFVDQAGVSILGVVPSLVRAWRRSSAMKDADWSGMRVFSSTGEPSNQEDYLWLMSRARYRAPVIEYLGGTEIGGGHITGTVVQPASPAAFTTPALGMDFVILDEQAAPVPEGGDGELFLIPPAIGLSQTLLNKLDNLDRDHDEVYYVGCPSGPNGEVLRRHGDRMARLHKGFFKAAGRADDAMNLGGIKVSSAELEQVLDLHPAVYESAAIAIQPEGQGADKLVVYAVLRDRVDQAELRRELGSLIASKLNPLFKLHDLLVIDALPRTPSNKIVRRELRARYRKKQ